MLALMVLFAQQAVQLHALAHAGDQLAQPQKGKPASHPIEQCIAFHAVGSALTSNAASPEFDSQHTARASWSPCDAPSASVYRLPARAPPQAVQLLQS
ncbi:MAG: hypothetical protein D4R74_06545 [Betaproteobacteria bacterium]|nr:MAG: hypothetical protein D4R74_06545 [Betaproteobacteria bacterium]